MNECRVWCGVVNNNNTMSERASGCGVVDWEGRLARVVPQPSTKCWVRWTTGVTGVTKVEVADGKRGFRRRLRLAGAGVAGSDVWRGRGAEGDTVERGGWAVGLV
jgi:hypothetical protein